LGCKFQNDMYYIVAGDMNLDNWYTVFDYDLLDFS
jgi:hypothetical protein